MTRDEILSLARQLGVLDENHYGSVWADRLADFAAAVESAARARQDALARLAEADAEIERAPSAEPVAWITIEEDGIRHGLRAWSDGTHREVPLYPHPQPDAREAIEQDAQRYRWLRAGIVGVTLPGASDREAYEGRCPRVRLLSLPSPSPCNDEIDAAIDALRVALGEDA